MSVRAGPRYHAARSRPSRTKPQRSATRIDAGFADRRLQVEAREARLLQRPARQQGQRPRRATPRPRSRGATQ